MQTSAILKGKEKFERSVIVGQLEIFHIEFLLCRVVAIIFIYYYLLIEKMSVALDIEHTYLYFLFFIIYWYVDYI